MDVRILESNVRVQSVEDEYLVRVFVVAGEKGEKGDKGDPGAPGSIWGSIEGNIYDQEDLSAIIFELSNYDNIENKPTINGTVVQGNLTSEDIGLYVDDVISPTSTNPLENKAVYEAIANAVEGLELEMPKIKFGITSYWDAEHIIAEENTIYVYTDYRKDKDGKNIAGIRVGDGKAYLSDLPFLDAIYYDHINNREVHVTNEEKEFWNNKVRCYYSLTNKDTLVFTTN